MQKVEWNTNTIGIFHLHAQMSLGRTLGDLLLSQTTVDAWGSFSRTFDPNPLPVYLAARGYAITANALKKAGPWNAVGSDGSPLRLLDAELKSVDWLEQQQCEILGCSITTLFK